MRKYDLYIIEDQFVNFYYGKERIFFNLFKDFETSAMKLKKILSKQIDYITKPIPSLRIHTHLVQQLQVRKDFYLKNGIYFIENGRGSASLQILPKKCILQSSGMMDLDMIFMEALRRTEYNLLAIDLENERYGWIKPMKEIHYI